MEYYSTTKTFDCSRQNLTTLPDDIPLECEKVYCNNNKITSLEPLSGLVNLRYLYCGGNKITSLKPLSELVNLLELYCGWNKITSLEPLSELVNLQLIWCGGNNKIKWVSVDLQKKFKTNFSNLNRYQSMFKHIPAKKIQRYWKLNKYRAMSDDYNNYKN